MPNRFGIHRRSAPLLYNYAGSTDRQQRRSPVDSGENKRAQGPAIKDAVRKNCGKCGPRLLRPRKSRQQPREADFIVSTTKSEITWYSTLLHEDKLNAVEETKEWMRRFRREQNVMLRVKQHSDENHLASRISVYRENKYKN